jgi:uncharacterized membrane protein
MLIEHVIEGVVPYVIHLLEAMGIIVIIVAATKAFWQYSKNIFSCEDHNIKVELAKALAFALEFKLASEILKTVIIRSLDEMYILASVITLRAILTFVIHWEIKSDTKHVKNQQNQVTSNNINQNF